MYKPTVTDFKPSKIIKQYADSLEKNLVFRTDRSQHSFMVTLYEYLRMKKINNMVSGSVQDKRYKKAKKLLGPYLKYIKFHNLDHAEMFSVKPMFTPKFFISYVKSRKNTPNPVEQLASVRFGERNWEHLEINFSHPKFGKSGIYKLNDIKYDPGMENMYFDKFTLHGDYDKKYHARIVSEYEKLLEASHPDVTAYKPNILDELIPLFTDFVTGMNYKDISIVNINDPVIVGPYADAVWRDFLYFQEHNFVHCNNCLLPLKDVFDDCFIRRFQHEGC